MVRLQSSAMWRAEYDADARMLHIWFTCNDRAHGYRDVPQEVFEGLCAAPSQGRYFATRIRDHYEVVPPP